MCLGLFVFFSLFFFFFFQAEDGIRDAQESRGLGDVYKRQISNASSTTALIGISFTPRYAPSEVKTTLQSLSCICLLYTSDAADDLLCVDLGGRRIIKKKKKNKQTQEGDIEKNKRQD